MPDWQMQTITDETMPRLPESKYHRMGGWLLVLAIASACVCVCWLFSFVNMVVRMWGTGLLAAAVQPQEQTSLAWVWILSILLLLVLPTVSCCLSLLWLLKRKIEFRIPFTIFAALMVFYVVYHGGFFVWLYLCAQVLGTIYVFTSDRVRVYCNKRPKRPVPMPVP